MRANKSHDLFCASDEADGGRVGPATASSHSGLARFRPRISAWPAFFGRVQPDALATPGSGKIRPIGIDKHFYRVVAKAWRWCERLVTSSRASWASVRPAASNHVRKVQDKVDDDADEVSVFLDLKNAFNMVSRSHLAAPVLEHNPPLFRAVR